MNIILIDDNHVIRFVIKKLLAKYFSAYNEPVNIYSSDDGVEGLGFIFLAEPKLIIVDTTLPKYGGLEVLDYLTSNEQVNNLKIPVIVLHEDKPIESLKEHYSVLNKNDPDFLNQFLKEIDRILGKEEPKGSRLFGFVKILAAKSIGFANRSDKALFSFTHKSKLLQKPLLLVKAIVSQLLTSVFLTLFFILSGRKDYEQNLEQKKNESFFFRVRVFPAFAIVLASCFVVTVQLVIATSLGISLVLLRPQPVLAVTRTWDGGGVGNNWSTCANWSGDVCPTAADDVVFNATSVKNATIDAGFTGTVLSVSINAGYTGIITQSRSLTITAVGAFSQNAGTYNGGAQTLNVASFGLVAGSFIAPANLNVGLTPFFAFSITGGTFSHNSGTITFQGTSGGSINNCNSNTFNQLIFTANTIVSVNNANCTLPLGNNPSIVTALHVTAGTLSGTGTLTFNTTGGGNAAWFDGGNLSGFSGLVANRTFRIAGSTINLGSYTTVDLNDQTYGSFRLDSGTFTAPSGTMTVAGDFTINGGTFNANGGTVTFDGTYGTLSCNSISFNLVTFNHSNWKIVGSNCSLPLGSFPSIPAHIQTAGPLSGSGTLTITGNIIGTALKLNTGSSLSGFSGLVVNSGYLQLNGGTANLGSYTTVDLNGTNSFQMLSGSFTAPSGNMTVAGNFNILGGTFDANGGTITLDGGTFETTIGSCIGATFNLVVFAHTGDFKAVGNCTLPLGSNPSSSGPVKFYGDAVLSGSGAFTIGGNFYINQSNNDYSAFSNVVVNGDLTNDNSTGDLPSSNMDVNGNVYLLTGGFVAPSGIMNVSGNFDASVGGDLIANNGTVNLVGTNQSISGASWFTNLNFNNLSKTTAITDTLTFAAGTTTRVAGTLTLNGASGNLLSLVSDSPGNQWYIYPVGPMRSVSFLDVQDSNNEHPVDIEAGGTGSVDSGNNQGWDFDATANIPAYNIYTVDPYNDQIRKLDVLYATILSTQSITLSGYTVLSANGLAYNPQTCTVYAILKLQGQSGRHLVTINPATGVATSVGNTGKNIAGIAFDSTGTLWGVTGDGEVNLPETLYTLSTSNGAPTFKVSLGNGDSGETIAYNPVDGYIYHLSGAGTRIFEKIDPVGLGVTNIPLTLNYDYGEATAMMYSSYESKFLLADSDIITRLTLTGTTSTWVQESEFNTIKGMVPTSCVALQAPDAPSSLGPANLVNGSTISDNTPQFTFSLTDPNTGETVQYQIQIDDNSDFSSPVVDYVSALGAQGAFSFEVGQALAGGTYNAGAQGQTLSAAAYYWRVRAIDELAMQGSYTTANSGNIAFYVSTVAALEISVSSSSADIGQNLSMTVTAKDGSNVTDPSYTGTVTFSSTSGTVTLPGNYSFTGGDAGVHTFTNQLTFNETGTFTVTVTDIGNGSLTDTSGNITVSAAGTPTPTPSISPTAVTENCAVDPNTQYCQQEVVIDDLEVLTDLPELAPGEVEVCWITNLPTIGYVEYGLAETGLYTESTAIESEYSLAHCITITGLDETQEYIFRVKVVSHAGKEGEQGGTFVGDKFSEAPAGEGCIQRTSQGVSFNNQQQALVNYETIGLASCILSYGESSQSLNLVTPSTPSGQTHTSVIELENFDGSRDIIYGISCNVNINEQQTACTLPGVVSANEYRPYLAPETPQQQSILQQIGEIFSGINAFVADASDDFLPITLASTVTGLAVTILATYPRAILYGFAWLRVKKRANPWGVIYDEAESAPVPFVSVRLYKTTEQGEEFYKEDISSLAGKYGFSADPGKYRMEIIHGDYEKQSFEVNVTSQDQLITRDINLQKKNTETRTNFRKFFKENLGKLNTILVYGGLIFSVIALAYNFSIINAGILGVYTLNSVLVFAFRRKIESGTVYDKASGNKIKGAFVRVFDTVEKRQLDVQMADEAGRYGFKLEPGEYLVSVNVDNYEIALEEFSQDSLYTSEQGQKYIKVKIEPGARLSLQIPMKTKAADLSQISTGGQSVAPPSGTLPPQAEFGVI